MEAPDGELIRVIAERGCEAKMAEAELCRRFGPRIRLYGLRHLRDEERAKDLVQAVLVAVLLAAREGRIDDPARVERFMLGTCRNVALRMKQRETRTEGSDALETLVADELASAPHDEVALDALWRCLSGLEERARRVVTLSFREELPSEDIARALETTAGNVRVVRHRAVAALRRCLDGQTQKESSQ